MAKKVSPLDEMPEPDPIIPEPEKSPEPIPVKATPKRIDPRKRVGKRAFTAYAGAKRLTALKVIAAQNGLTLQDLIERGMDYVLREYGQDNMVQSDLSKPLPGKRDEALPDA